MEMLDYDDVNCEVVDSHPPHPDVIVGLSEFICTIRDYVRTGLEEWLWLDAPFSGSDDLPYIVPPPDDFDDFPF